MQVGWYRKRKSGKKHQYWRKRKSPKTLTEAPRWTVPKSFLGKAYNCPESLAKAKRAETNEDSALPSAFQMSCQFLLWQPLTQKQTMENSFSTTVLELAGDIDKKFGFIVLLDFMFSLKMLRLSEVSKLSLCWV